MSCLFCDIAAHKISSDIIYEDDDVTAFRDISPQAPTHVLIIPKEHIATVNDLTEENADIIAKMTLTAKKLAKKEGIADEGYRLVMNCNKNAGQAVFHIHMHLLGGRQLQWPPG